MALPSPLDRLRLPVIGSPMFIASNPALVTAQCRAGLVGSFPALNARPQARLDEWLDEIAADLAAHDEAHPEAPAAPFAVNQIIHKSNVRLEQDLRTCIDRKVPIIISSLRAPDEIIDEVHGYGGLVFHDVINIRHAEKALAAGVDGLILVCAGAGGHAGTLSPFALLGEVRRIFDGPVVLAGAIGSGDAILAAQAAGADLAYVGTPWLATHEANTVDGYRQALVDAKAKDIVYTDYFTGVHGNYLRSSIEAAGLDPEEVRKAGPGSMDFGASDEGEDGPKAWKDIWSAGQGVGLIDRVESAADVAERLSREYADAITRLRERVVELRPGNPL